ncbi:MAG: hypothetical protein ACLP8Y_01035 [Thermoplasmata archaeon]
MSPRRERHRAGRGWVVGVSVVLLVLAALLLTIEVAPAWGSERSVSTVNAPVSLIAAPENCSSTVLASLTATPANISVTPLEVQTFSATADSACGTPLVQNVNVSWWLSSASLGTLSSSSGPTTAYTACLALMGGFLHLKATSGGITRYANSSISVSLHSTPGQDPPPGSSDGASGGAGSSSPVAVPWGALAIMIALLGGAAIVLVIGRRRGE